MNAIHVDEGARDDAGIEAIVHDGTICLVGGSPRNITELPTPVRLRVLDGTVWLTQRDDLHDYVIKAGEEVWMEGGSIVIEALTPFAYMWLGHADLGGPLSEAEASFQANSERSDVKSDCPAG